MSISFHGRRLTKAGYELLQLLDPTLNNELFDYIGQKLIDGGAKAAFIHKILTEDGERVTYVTNPERSYKKDDKKTT